MIRVRSRAIRRPETNRVLGAQSPLFELLWPRAWALKWVRSRSIAVPCATASTHFQAPPALRRQISARHHSGMNWPGGQRDATVDNRPSWMKTLPPAPVSPAKTIKRPNPSRFQAPAPAPVVAPPVPVAAPVAAPSVPLAARAPPANHYGPAPLQPPPAAIGYRTRLCKHWLASGGTYCAYGAHCDFAHGEDQLLRHYAPHPPPYMQHGQPPAPPRGRSRSRGRRRGGHSRRRRSPSSSRSSSSSSSSSGRRSRSRSPRRNRYDTALPRHGQPPARARSPSPASGLGPRPKRRHLVSAAEAAPAPEPAAPAEAPSPKRQKTTSTQRKGTKRLPRWLPRQRPMTPRQPPRTTMRTRIYPRSWG